LEGIVDQDDLRRVAAALVPVGPSPPFTWAALVAFEEGRAPYPAPYAARVTWQVADGRAVPTAVTLHAMHGQAVTAQAWRSVRLSEVIERSRGMAGMVAGLPAEVHRMGNAVGRALGKEAQPEPPHVAHSRAAAQAFRRHPERKRGGPPQFSEDHYRRVAEVYLAAVAVSDPHPVLAVVKAFGGDPRTDRVRAKGWVAQARRRGLIPPTTREDD
jgi:hypothetical protein